MGLGSILGTIGGIIGAPFTGGSSLAWGPMLGGLGEDIVGSIKNGGLPDTLTGAAKGGLTAQQQQDALKVALANANTSRMGTAAALPGKRLSTSVKAGMTSRAAPAKISWGGPGSGLRGEIPTTSGGFHDTVTPTGETKQLSDQIMHDELLSQLQGGPSAPGGGTDMAMPEVGQETTGDKILGGAGLGTSILSSILKGSKRPIDNVFTGPSTVLNPEDPANADPDWWDLLPQM